MPAAARDLVLVGGGHTHVQVLRRWITHPLAGVRLTVVLDRPEAVYSGMVPGFVAGDYATRELEIDVAGLARRAGAHLVVAPATGIDPQARRIRVAGRAAIAWDVASLDVGSTIRGHDLPGVREHALATRPIRTLVDRLASRVAQASRATTGAMQVRVVGAGAAGVELACTLDARLHRHGVRTEITILTDEDELLTGYPRRVAARMRHELDRRRVAVRERVRAIAVERDALVLETARLPADLVVCRERRAVAGGEERVVALDLERRPDAQEVRVVAGQRRLREEGQGRGARRPGRGLRRFRPQRDFLSLLNLGDRRALAAKWGLVAVGGWVWRLKDRIDRRFVARFAAP